MLRAGVLISIGLLALAACQTPTPAAPTAGATATARPIVAATSAPTTAPPSTPVPTATTAAATSTTAPTANATSTAEPTQEATPAPTTAPATNATSTAEPTQATTPIPTTAPTANATSTAEPTQAATPTPAPTSIPATPAAPATRAVFVNADSVNFRDGPSTTANVILVLAQGTPLTAIGQPTPPDTGGLAWQAVQTSDGRSGWVAAQLLSDTAPAAPTPTSIAPGYVYVASINGLNLRADHAASSPVLVTLANGQRLQTNGLNFGPDSDGITWLNVKTDDNREGWVSAEFVDTTVPSVKPAVPPTNEADIAAELLRRTNALRQQYNLPPYVLDTGLTALALEHSQYMAQNGITHIGAGGLSASKRIANLGYGGRPTENIYGGLASIEDAWKYWSEDPPHLQNLLNEVNTLIGIGVYNAGPGIYYYTQDFAGPIK